MIGRGGRAGSAARGLMVAALLTLLGGVRATPAAASPSATGDGDAGAGQPTALAPVPVVLQPFERFPPSLVEAVAAGLHAEYGALVTVLPPIAPPREAWRAARRRYRADSLLDFLRPLAPKGARVLGLAPFDISTTKGEIEDWGVFGLGDLDGTACVVSSHRLKRNARGRAHLERRLVSTAVHEVGHTLGLPHCPTDGCVMHDAMGSIRNTDTGDGHVCARCRALLRARAAPADAPAP